MEAPEPGERYTYRRRFTPGDVRQFARLTGDRAARHVEPGDRGQLMVHGLLTASLCTKIGGDLELLATRMDFRFLKPVYTGQEVTCVWIHDRVEERKDRFDVTVSVACHTTDEEPVMEGTIEGVLMKDP